MTTAPEPSHELTTNGVGPHPEPWPDDPRLDPELLAAGDSRNVLDHFRYWSMDAIVAELDTDPVAPGTEVATGGVYGDEGYVYQLFDPLPEFDGFRPALGAWIVGDEAAGLGIRETVGLVTDDGAAFVPHRIPAE